MSIISSEDMDELQEKAQQAGRLRRILCAYIATVLENEGVDFLGDRRGCGLPTLTEAEADTLWEVALEAREIPSPSRDTFSKQ